ncbi:MAG TPA: cell division topological specificity factor MinE [Desulfomicrobiaceae bacterium]|jgi:cell division topological specificity factor|nr:cell division topological specificity factor MinE [Desulfomicrobiaceae bacterium]
MKFFDYFRTKTDSRKSDSARVAKGRLQIIVAHERSQSRKLDYLPELQQEILKVVRRYVDVDEKSIKIDVGQEGNCEVLELNVILPESSVA